MNSRILIFIECAFHLHREEFFLAVIKKRFDRLLVDVNKRPSRLGIVTMRCEKGKELAEETRKPEMIYKV